MKKEEIEQQYIKTRCNGCMTYFDYDENLEECPFCRTGAYLTDLTKEDIKYLKDKNLY